jgi:phosphinothricin acetyltransferase
MAHTIRMATPDDAAAIASIYGPYCDSTAVSFEVVAPSTEEMALRIRTTTTQFPWLVLDVDGEVAGYAYASRHAPRAAYGWSVDTAVYVASTHHRRGVARALYAALFPLLRVQGYFNAYAGIALPNPASVGLHEAEGFTLVGVYDNVGYKLGAWHAVAWYHLALQRPRAEPDPPREVTGVVDTSQWKQSIERGLASLGDRRTQRP